MNEISQAPPPQESFLEELRWRGFLEQCTDEPGLDDLLAHEIVTGYIGFDPTADSLHIGSLLPILGLVHLQRHGHRPIGIVGGGTAMVGDPSGRTEMRQLLLQEQIQRNLSGLREQLARFIRFGDGPRDGVLLDNAEWLCQWNYIDFLREIGRHFSVNRMLSMESVKTRLESGLSFIEFNYMLLQAVDFLEMHRRHGCRLQMGGSDQWGNIVAGIDLVRRLERQEVFGLTFPLLSTATGSKMGKTAAGAVWLDARRTSPFDFFQYWVNVDDRDVGRFLRLYTLLPRQEIERYEALQGAELREAKRVLASEVTALVHGRQEAEAAAQGAAALFRGGSLAGAIPSSQRPAGDLGSDLRLLDVLVETSLCASKAEARRMVRQRAVRVNGVIVTEETRPLGVGDVKEGRIKLQVGRKKHHHLIIN
jgi:tyrosyl-tRNA synthetase